MDFGFPNALYPGQARLIRDAVAAVKARRVAVLSSPTGTGKTLALLCTALSFITPPADTVSDDTDISALLSTRSKTVVYYCSRTHSQLAQVIAELKKNTRRYNAVILASRKHYCIHEPVYSGAETGEVVDARCRAAVRESTCPFFSGPGLVSGPLDIEDLRRRGRQEKFCPYYVARRRAAECELVLLPYNALLAARGRDGLGIDLTDKIVIIDEAHNIYQAVIDLNSAEIDWKVLRHVLTFHNIPEPLSVVIKRLLSSEPKNLSAGAFTNQICMDKIGDLHKFKENGGKRDQTLDYQSINHPPCNPIDKTHKNSDMENDDLIFPINEFIARTNLGAFNMFEIEDLIYEKKLAQRNDTTALFELAKLLKLLTYSDSSGRVALSRQRLRFTPLSPALYFQELTRCTALLLAGGTMEPVGPLQRVFPQLVYHTYPPVAVNLLPLVVHETVRGRALCLTHSERDARMEETIATLVTLTTPIQTGGILIFVPSYHFLHAIRRSTRLSCFRRPVQFEDEISIADFERSPQILIGVLGGRLSEGINFADELCRLLIVVGVPYPPVSPEQKAREAFSPGWSLATAMQRVNQALGRAVRHARDYAVLILLDARYRQLKAQLPPWVLAKTEIVSPVQAILKARAFLQNLKVPAPSLE